MRDPGLEQAIRAAGGVGALARKVGISQPSVSNWGRVPAERVILVEGVTGINRAVLRPDLYGVVGADEVDDIDTARTQEYALLALLLRRAADAHLLTRLAALRGDPSPLGLEHAALAERAAATNAERVERVFFDLFIGMGRGELLPYRSYYLTGFLNERPLARLRDDLAQFGEGEVEPEDHAAVLCEIMAGLVGGRFEAPVGADRALFGKHLGPWIGRFFADLEQAEAADLYRRIGTVGRVFMEIEREAFSLAG